VDESSSACPGAGAGKQTPLACRRVGLLVVGGHRVGGRAGAAVERSPPQPFWPARASQRPGVRDGGSSPLRTRSGRARGRADSDHAGRLSARASSENAPCGRDQGARAGGLQHQRGRRLIAGLIGSSSSGSRGLPGGRGGRRQKGTLSSGRRSCRRGPPRVAMRARLESPRVATRRASSSWARAVVGASAPSANALQAAPGLVARVGDRGRPQNPRRRATAIQVVAPVLG